MYEKASTKYIMAKLDFGPCQGIEVIFDPAIALTAVGTVADKWTCKEKYSNTTKAKSMCIHAMFFLVFYNVGRNVLQVWAWSRWGLLKYSSMTVLR